MVGVEVPRIDPDSGYVLKGELMGCTDRWDVGEADGSKKVPSLLARVRCGSLRRPLTPATRSSPLSVLCASPLGQSVPLLRRHLV